MNGHGIEKDPEKTTYWAIFAAKLGSGNVMETLFQLMSSYQAKFKAGYGPPTSLTSWSSSEK